MKRYAWATDIHLDHLIDRFSGNDEKIVRFAKTVAMEDFEGLLLTGDLSVSEHLASHLEILAHTIQRPVYFVMGNHDHWGSSTSDLRARMHELSEKSSFIRYLPTRDFFSLSQTTALVGHDGWYDAFNGNWKTSDFYLNDWNYTFDFLGTRNLSAIVDVARSLAAPAVAHVKNGISQAVKAGHKTIVVMTHFPPFEEVHVYRGRPGDDAAAPWYTSKLMGDMLLQAAHDYRDNDFLVLAGHTHGHAQSQIASNMFVEVGEAEYGSPKIQRFIEVT